MADHIRETELRAGPGVAAQASRAADRVRETEPLGGAGPTIAAQASRAADRVRETALRGGPGSAAAEAGGSPASD